jgi:hypothetical protein
MRSPKLLCSVLFLAITQLAHAQTAQVAGMKFRVPDGWQVQTKGHMTIIAPEAAHQRTQAGKEWLSYGIFAGGQPAQGDLKGFSDALFQTFLKGSPQATKTGTPQEITLGGARGLVQEYANPQSDAPAPESGMIVTLKTNDGFAFLILFCPTAEKSTYTPTFRTVLTSVAVGDGQSAANAESSSAASPVYVEPWQTLVRQTVPVIAGRAAFFNFNLPHGAKLLTEFMVEGGLNNKVSVLLLDEQNYQHYAAKQPFNTFKGTSGDLRGVGRYVFEVPNDGTYYIVMDNGRAWLMQRQVTLHLDAILPGPTAESERQADAFNKSYDLLKKAFIFPDFHISVKHCGVENAFSDPNITLCAELIEALQDKGLGGAMGFVFFHELGHTMLRTWGYPLSDNEDVADEFATVFLIMSHQQQSAMEAAKWWASQTSTGDAVAKVFMDDRHTLSPQRARNILHWLQNDNELVSRWMKIFIPNMQTDVVRSLLNDPTIHVDRELVLSELRKRGITQASAPSLP